MRNKTSKRLLALCLAVCLCLSMSACFGKDKPGNDQTNPTMAAYTVEIKTEGGMALEDINVYVYEDSSLTDLVAVEKTDKEGKVSFQAPESDSYMAVLQKVPEGYALEDRYPITGELTQIVLKAQMVEGELDKVSYSLGSLMQDFTFTAADGKEYKLSQLLETKKAVVLNFWYLNCGPCKTEFPYLQEAYAQYSDSIEVLAMNPVDGDDASITAFAQELGLTFPMGKCDPAWEKAMQLSAYPTTVIIDRFGSIGLIHKGYITNTQTFTGAFGFFTAEDYVQTTVEDIEELIVEEVPTGTVDNPTEIGGVTQFQLSIEAGKTVYVDLYKVTNMWLQINSGDISVEYKGKNYGPSGGSVGLLVTTPDTYTPAKLGFTNNSDKLQTITVYLSALPGSMDNPYKLSVGEFNASVNAGNDKGVYYNFTAPEDGTLTLQCLRVTAGVDYDFSLYNLNSYAMRTAGESPAVDGYRAVSIQAKKGQVVQFSAGTLPDSTNSYPAASFTFKASFTAGEIEEIEKVEQLGYAITVTDENRNPVEGVNIRFSGEENGTSITTDANGVASVWLPKGSYTATLVVPKGYTASTTQFKLTETLTTVSAKLDTVIDTTQTYTVRVIDDTGAAVPGALVTVGESYGRTDDTGFFSVDLEKGSYTVVIGIPSGYSAETTVYEFPENENYLTVTLTKGGSSEQEGEEYTVQVVDGSGNVMTGILVNFQQDGLTVASVEVDENGFATAILPSGDYTVSLVSANGDKLVYDEQEAFLPAENPLTVITVAIDISGSAYESEWWGNYLILHTGSTNVELDTAMLNHNDDYAGDWMYVFAPSMPGVYQLSVSEGAVLRYWGSINYPIGPLYTTDNEDGYFELSVRSGEFDNGNQPSFVLGVSENGAQQAMITIVRVGDVTGDLPVEVYEPATAPTQFTLTESGTPTYVDITGTANVEKRADGYYLNGKKLYINLGPNAPYLSMYNMLGVNSNMGTGLKGNRYDENGVAIVREDYTQCMTDYAKCIDSKSGLYPLNDDIAYMIQNAGAYLCWWDETNPNYLFTDVPGTNPETAWLFACCYFN